MNSTNGTKGNVTLGRGPTNVSPTTVRLDPLQDPGVYNRKHYARSTVASRPRRVRVGDSEEYGAFPLLVCNFLQGQPDRPAIGLGYLIAATVVPQLLGQSWEFCLHERPSRPGLLFNR